MITISFYDTKPYDREYFNLINEQYGFTINYFETRALMPSALLSMTMFPRLQLTLLIRSEFG